MEIRELLQQVREENPLVHNMTNQVVANDVANSLIALGASPMMAYAEEEVEEVAQFARAVVLNIGTITKETADAMIKIGRAANKNNVPVVLDPVGVGATSFRKEIVAKLTDAIQFTAIRGNAAEMATVAGKEWESKGVDAGRGHASKEDIVRTIAQNYQCVAAISGEVDFVSDGTKVISISNGHLLMGKITGSGCMLSGLCGAFVSLLPKEPLDSIVAAHTVYTIAGERAGERSDVQGPGTFRAALMDELYRLDPSDAEKEACIQYVEEDK